MKWPAQGWRLPARKEDRIRYHSALKEVSLTSRMSKRTCTAMFAKWMPVKGTL
jgi:hypothetical protein